ncbi:MAG: dTDP-4-dehydrorhamnose 3,5-epimerase [Bacteroidales bacterium]|nr:dTDP-4-dehydrorhamnose 3,5-epimerase [Bacteroidales bacterium]
MEIIKKKIKGTYEIILKPIKDNRGFFLRTYDNKIFDKFGINKNWVQENHSKSEKKGIIRGLHFQLPPFLETKLVRCIRGSVFDVFVDLRKNSPTFGQWDSIILSENSYNYAYIPRGCAHGFCTLTDISEVIYKVDNYYAPDYETGIIWNDKDLKIEWIEKNPILSEKDSKNITFSEFIKNYQFIEIIN